VLVAISFACLTIAFVQHDFSVQYVASNSNSALPLEFRIAAVWGGHEGSMLLWLLMQCGWMGAVALFSRNLPLPVLARILSVMSLTLVGFLLFTLLTSNPFDRLVPAAPDGRDLNPLLQDPGMIFHPPLLYMGYVGFAVAFSFAVAALIGGNLDAQWARWTRPWTTAAWIFLTLGIALGSWWAYYELGWGGWWFWDPVENASFMPWLVGTALIHSLAVTEKRGAFKAWTVLLAIAAFSLYAWRAPTVGLGTRFSQVSRESFLLANNVLLVVAAGAVLLGTLYPLVLDALGLGKISVGPPYFDTVFVPLMAPLVFLMGVGPLARWKEASLPDLARRVRWAAVVTLLAALGAGWAEGEISWMGSLGLAMAFWIVATLGVDLWERVRPAGGMRSSILHRLRQLPRAMVGMMVAHLGVAAFILGVTIVNTYQVERDVTMQVGDTTEIAGYVFTFRGVREVDGPNFTAVRGTIDVTKGERAVVTMSPEKRVYRVQTMPMTEAAIYSRVTGDLYVSLGQPDDKGAWVVRVYYKPFVTWIWGGCVIMALGGLLAASDRRYRVARREQAAAKTVEAAA
jgi:cytochrome c-type biogenesis protein CcmF